MKTLEQIVTDVKAYLAKNTKMQRVWRELFLPPRAATKRERNAQMREADLAFKQLVVQGVLSVEGRPGSVPDFRPKYWIVRGPEKPKDPRPHKSLVSPGQYTRHYHW